MTEPARSPLQASYDQVADAYVERIFQELDGKPFDRALLDRFAARLAGAGVICDLGCGPGQVARYLADRGATVCGVDLSAAMVARAQALSPDIPFSQGDMRALPVGAGAWAGIAAFYSILHVPPQEHPALFAELRRALRPDGHLLLAFHVGDHRVHLDEWWGHPVDVDFYFLDPDGEARALTAAGFTVEEAQVREPYPEVEHPSRRAYLWARRRDLR